MSIDENRIRDLADKWLKGTIAAEERAEFMSWYNQADEGSPLNIPREFAGDELSHGMRMFNKIHQKTIGAEETPNVKKIGRIHVLRTVWFRYAAAILLILCAGAYFFSLKSTKKELSVVLKPSAVQNDVRPPSTVHAMITLSDGRKIILDSLANGIISNEGNVHLTKVHEGQIVYAGNSNEVSYNTLTNPRGSRVIQVTLSDGTKVWLNSESSIRYPTSFTTNERVVEVTGEIYFEVTKNLKMPFKVRKGFMEVTVLGTHFDVNAYEDEEQMKVTLLEGAVQVESENKNVSLVPGQQSLLGKTGSLTKIDGVDMEGVMAWKNGKFDFGTKTDIGTIMRQIARWYNLELEYKGTISRYYGGSISRDVNLSQVLKVLETTGDIQFELNGNKLLVMP